MMSEKRDYMTDEDMDDRGGDRHDEKRRLSGGQGRKKACRFCTDTETVLDYKNVRMIQSLVTEQGRLIPRRVSGCCAKHQRKLRTAIMRARQLALVGYVSIGN